MSKIKIGSLEWEVGTQQSEGIDWVSAITPSGAVLRGVLTRGHSKVENINIIEKPAKTRTLDEFQTFDKLIPYHEYGVHTIESIEIFEVVNEYKLL